jgi:predicted deacylase
MVAATLFRLIGYCDYALDTHTQTRGGRYVPIAILPHQKLGPAAQTAEQMAHALGTGWVMRGESGIYVSDGGLCNEATTVGIPALTFEIGEVGRLEEDSVATGARCVLNLLRFLNMIDADIKPTSRSLSPPLSCASFSVCAPVAEGCSSPRPSCVRR